MELLDGVWALDTFDGLVYDVYDHSELFLELLRSLNEEQIELMMTTTWQVWKTLNLLVWEIKQTIEPSSMFLTWRLLSLHE